MGTNPESAAVEAVAWAMTDYQADGANTQFTRDRHAAEYWGEQGIQIDPLYPQSALDALRGEVERLRAIEAAARTYYREYCQDEAGDELLNDGRGMWTGATAKQINDAAALRDALTKE